MACLSAPHIPKPDLSLFLPTISIPSPVPQLGIALCCKFKTPPIPGFPIILPIGALLAALGAAGDAIIALIDSIIDLLNSLIDLIPPVNCPLDELS